MRHGIQTVSVMREVQRTLLQRTNENLKNPEHGNTCSLLSLGTYVSHEPQYIKVYKKRTRKILSFKCSLVYSSQDRPESWSCGVQRNGRNLWKISDGKEKKAPLLSTAQERM